MVRWQGCISTLVATVAAKVGVDLRANQIHQWRTGLLDGEEDEGWGWWRCVNMEEWFDLNLKPGPIELHINNILILKPHWFSVFLPVFFLSGTCAVLYPLGFQHCRLHARWTTVYGALLGGIWTNANRITLATISHLRFWLQMLLFSIQICKSKALLSWSVMPSIWEDLTWPQPCLLCCHTSMLMSFSRLHMLPSFHALLFFRLPVISLITCMNCTIKSADLEISSRSADLEISSSNAEDLSHVKIEHHKLLPLCDAISKGQTLSYVSWSKSLRLLENGQWVLLRGWWAST